MKYFKNRDTKICYTCERLEIRRSQCTF